MLQFTAFQSTSSCGFMHVNALNQCQLFAEVKNVDVAFTNTNGVSDE